jgi:hypothetical protein
MIKVLVCTSVADTQEEEFHDATRFTIESTGDLLIYEDGQSNPIAAYNSSNWMKAEVIN